MANTLDERALCKHNGAGGELTGMAGSRRAGQGAGGQSRELAGRATVGVKMS